MINRSLAALCSLLYFAACSTEKAQPNPPGPAPAPAIVAATRDSSPTNIATDASKESQPIDVDTLEAAAIRRASDMVSRVGSELRIRLRDGRVAILKDDTTAGMKFALPRYVAYLKAIHSHVVHRYQYEGEGIYFVVDDSTGDSTVVYGLPVVSPDGERFVTTSMAGMEGGNPGEIDVWRMVDGKPEQEFSYDTEHEPWEASDAVWRDSVTIDFMKNSASDPSKPYVKTPGRLTRAGTTWTLAASLH
jgi:hypothetical protein